MMRRLGFMTAVLGLITLAGKADADGLPVAGDDEKGNSERHQDEEGQKPGAGAFHGAILAI